MRPLCLALLLACRVPSPELPPAPVPAPAVASPPAETKPAPPAAVGLLEDPAALATVFAALDRMERDVRIVELGDSHVAADWETGPLRRLLQARFGDGGRGFVPLGRPWKAWSQEGVLSGLAGDWATRMNRPGDGPFGLAGFALESRQPGARAWLDVLVDASASEVAYLEQPGGGSFDLVVDGHPRRIATRADARRTGYSAFDLAPGNKHHLEVHPLGDGAVRVYGVALDRDPKGVVLDALGVNGTRIATALAWDEAWAEDLRHRAPALVILAYGTNDAVDYETSLEAFERGLNEELARVVRATPASCLVLGPPDRAKAPRLPAVIAAERRAALAGHCAFFDRQAAMGGPGSIAHWGGPDRVHLSREGYARTATAFANDFIAAFELWRTSK